MAIFHDGSSAASWADWCIKTNTPVSPNQTDMSTETELCPSHGTKRLAISWLSQHPCYSRDLLVHARVRTCCRTRSKEFGFFRVFAHPVLESCMRYGSPVKADEAPERTLRPVVAAETEPNLVQARKHAFDLKQFMSCTFALRTNCCFK